MRLEELQKTLQANYSRLQEARPFDGSRMELARRMGVGDGTLGRVMYGTANVSLDTIARLAAWFRVQPWELLRPERDHADQFARENHAPYRAVDEVKLAAAIEALDKALAADDLVLSRAKQARAITMIYRYLVTEGRPLSSEEILTLIRKTA